MEDSGRMIVRDKMNRDGEIYREVYFVCEDCLTEFDFLEVKKVDPEDELLIEEFGESEAAFIVAVESGKSLAFRHFLPSVHNHPVNHSVVDWQARERYYQYDRADVIDMTVILCDLLTPPKDWEDPRKLPPGLRHYSEALM